MKPSELLTDETRWTQGALARTVDNEICSPGNVSAAKWCLLGLICRCYVHDGRRADDAWGALGRLLKADPAAWQDVPGRTWTEVRDALRAVGE